MNQTELKHYFSYDPGTGVFKRIYEPRHGTPCLSVNGRGYIRIKFNGREYLAHRMAWLFMRGVMPSGDIDHINGDQKDNRIVNLRECTDQQNSHNSAVRIDNKSGFKGVSWCNKKRKFRAQIQLISKRRITLGCFDTPELASAAYQVRAKEIHGEFYRDTIGGKIASELCE